MILLFSLPFKISSPPLVPLFLFYYSINNNFSVCFQILALINKSLWYPYDYSLIILSESLSAVKFSAVLG